MRVGPADARFTSRVDGDLAVGRDPAHLERRRARLTTRPWFWMHQVHGDQVVVVDDDGPEPGAVADAAVTASTRWALAVHTADCAPVVLAGDGVVGVAHAGWRGLSEGVLEATVGAMRDLGARTIEARLGPCIHAECYEFGADDLAPLVERFGPEVAATARSGRPALDLPTAVSRALRGAGVDALEIDPTCTACHTGYFSHRARADVGRQATVAWLVP